MKRTMPFFWLLLLGCGAFAADEIKVSTSLAVNNGEFALTRQVAAYAVTQSGTAADYGIQNVSTSPASLNVANVTTPRYAFFRNLSTNYSMTLSLTVKLRPKDVALLPLSTTGVVAAVVGTNAETANVEYWINAE